MSYGLAKWIVVISFVAGIALGGVVVPPGESAVQPGPPAMFTWSEDQVEVVLSPGEATDREVTVSADTSLNGVTLAVTGPIAEFLSVEPETLLARGRNQEETVTLRFSVPAETPLGTYEGAVEARRGFAILTPSLAVVVRHWPSVDANILQFSYSPDSLPAGAAFGDPTVGPRSTNVTFISVPLIVDSNPPLSAIGLLVHSNPGLLSLTEWFDTHIDGTGVLAQAGSFALEELHSGSQALVLAEQVPEEYTGPPLSFAYVMATNDSSVASIALGQDNDLHLVGLDTADERRTLLRQIIETMRF